MEACKLMSGDDWEPGVYVTVMKPRESEVASCGLFGPVTMTRQIDRSGINHIYEVVSVCLPKVLLREAGGIFGFGSSQWDVNEYTFGRVSNEYAEAVIAAAESDTRASDEDG